jgi:CRISPR-associated protein Csm2
VATNQNQRGQGGYQGGGYQGSSRQGGFGARGDDRDDTPTINLQGIVFGAKPAADLFSTQAERAAEEVSRASEQMNKSSQLRRFYDELVMWQEKVGSDDAKFTDCEPYIRMLKAKAAYAKGRKHVDANFRAMFDRLIDQSSNAATLRQAKLFFEAFMAYYKIHRAQ